MRNELLKLSTIVPREDAHAKIADWFNKMLSETPKLYSYKVLLKLKDDIQIGWQIEVMVSQTDSYNTIKTFDACMDCIDIVNQGAKEQTVLVGFKQPPIDLMVQLYEPLVNKLASEQQLHWPIELEDLKQICRLTIIKLWDKGYFIHKSLIQKTFIRDVLLLMRSRRKDVDEIKFSKLDKEKREYVAYIEDESAQDDFDCIVIGDREELDNRREIVQDMVGKRTYEQMLREYQTKTVSSITRTRVNRLKNKLGGTK